MTPFFTTCFLPPKNMKEKNKIIGYDREIRGYDMAYFLIMTSLYGLVYTIKDFINKKISIKNLITYILADKIVVFLCLIDCLFFWDRDLPIYFKDKFFFFDKIRLKSIGLNPEEIYKKGVI